MPSGRLCPEASVVGAPPASGTFITVPSPMFVQYALAVSTTTFSGLCPEAILLPLRRQSVEGSEHHP
jgi:hypothetical protein